MCSLFRNESPHLSSLLITQAVAATRSVWDCPPPEGFVTFVDPTKTRRKRDPGRCYRKAGWKVCGATKKGLIALRQLPEEMPPAEAPPGAQMNLWAR